MNLNQREENQKVLNVGYQEVSVVGVNPTKDQLVDLLGITDQEVAEKFREPEYVKQKEEGDEVTIAFYVKNPKTEKVEPIYFTIVDKDRISNSGKAQYINQLGEFQWVDDEANLWESFTNFVQVTKWKVGEQVYEKYKDGAKPAETKSYGKKYFRKALQGEEQLYNFLKAALLSIDYRNSETNILLDNKSLFKGNFKELQNVIKDKSIFGSVVVCYTVKSKESEGGFQEVQRINNKFFLPGTSMKFLRNFGLTSQKLEDLRYKKDAKRKLSAVEAFFVDTTDGENGIKDYWTPVEFTEYDSAKNPLMSEAPVVVESNSSY